jgi:hypothetical protein
LGFGDTQFLISKFVWGFFVLSLEPFNQTSFQVPFMW